MLKAPPAAFVALVLPGACNPSLEQDPIIAAVSRRLQKLSLKAAVLFYLAPNLRVQMVN